MGLGSLYRAWRRRSIYRRALAARSRVVVLRYHAVGEPSDVARYLDPGLSISPARFREQMQLVAARFRPILPGEIDDAMRRGRGGPPALAVTFDDGYRDNHDVALPILRETGVPAAFFVTTGPLADGETFWISELWRIAPRLPIGPLAVPLPGAPAEVPDDPAGRVLVRRRLTRLLAGVDRTAREAALTALARAAGVERGAGLAGTFLRPEQVRAMRAAGMAIGAHTRSHPHLDRLDPAAHTPEVAGSRADLETLLGEPVRLFAYPNPSGGGAVSDAARASVAAAGFARAFTSIPDPLDEDGDPLRTPRLGVYGGEQEKLLFRLLGDARGR